ncbi:MAG TPA: STAS domain-containing protein [Thermohalobaculum sp.]|nr:STAS domain-containing protein [Thermohalobaculum sp.]
MTDTEDRLSEALQEEYDAVLARWLRTQSDEGLRRTDLVPAEESEQQSKALLGELVRAMREAPTDGIPDLQSPHWDSVRTSIESLSDARIERGVNPLEMSQFIAAMKPGIFEALKKRLGSDADALVAEIWRASKIVDTLALHAMEVFVHRREQVIEQQRDEMSEVSAPVVKLWDRIVTVPLIGTLDSYRSQTVMENLLEALVEREAEVAVIDITGVSTVDTLVAQHLLKTAAAVRLMGAECVICGVSPKIAQTIVHLGVEMPNVITRVDLQSGLSYAFERIGLSVNAR